MLYLEEEQRVNQAVEEAGSRYSVKSPGIGENPDTRQKRPVSGKDSGEIPIDHEKSTGKADDAPPLGGGGTSANSEEKSSAAGSQFVSWLTDRAGDPARGRIASARELLKQAPLLPGIPHDESSEGKEENA
jgi:hypothetical protein